MVLLFCAMRWYPAAAETRRSFSSEGADIHRASNRWCRSL